MSKVLVVVDMQNDFIDGALGTKEAVAIVPYVKEKIENFDGIVLYTRDTHFEDYMNTQEGHNLPVPHCIKGTKGWEIREELDALHLSVYFPWLYGLFHAHTQHSGEVPESVGIRHPVLPASNPSFRISITNLLQYGDVQSPESGTLPIYI